MSRLAGRARAPLLALLLAATAAPLAGQRSAPAVHPGDAKLYVGTYKNILVIDEATSRVEHEIEVRNGIPATMVLSASGEHFYVLNTLYETIEVIDLATRSTIGQLTLSSGNRKVRIWGYNVDPQERYAVLAVKAYTKRPDRFEVSEPMLLRYDLQQNAVVDTIPWPRGVPSGRTRILFSRDGESLYLFANEVVVLETENFTEVERWPYEDALGADVGRFSYGFPDQPYEEPGYFTGLFRTTDPSQNRALMGVARVNLDEREVEFRALGPSENVTFSLAPGGARAYGIYRNLGNSYFWTFDLQGNRVIPGERFPGWNRMLMMTSSNGKVLYVYNAGNTIDLYEAETQRFIRRIDLDYDILTGLFFVLPANARASTTTSR